MWWMTAKTTEELQAQIERLVRDHLAAQQKATSAAVERAFAGVTVAVPRRNQEARSTAARRRPTTEMAEVAERLCEAVRLCPGETMATIAARVGEKPRALNRPMRHLKRAGRVRSAGQRNFTRYFPMAAAKPE